MLSKYKFIELVEGSPTNRGTFFEIQHNWQIDYFDKDIITDGYYSVFHHSDEYVSHGNDIGTKANYNGSVGAECLYWDLDDTNLERAFEECKVLYKRLLGYNVYPQNIKVYYSGCKGFHVVYVAPELKQYENESSINELIKSICYTIAHDLNTFDSRIYDKTRIFRSPNTINGKTGLFKVELPEHFTSWTLDQIKEYAKTKQRGWSSSNLEVPPSKDLLAVFDKAKGYSTTNKPTGKFTSSQLLEGIRYGFPEGDRNNGLTSVAGMLHRRNFSSDIINAILSSINANSVSPLHEWEISNIANSVSKYPVDPLFIDPVDSDIVTMAGASKAWYDLRTKTRTVSTGFEHLDRAIPYFDPGQVLMIAARAGIGKTTAGMQISNAIGKSLDGYGLFTSLEMPKESIFARAASVVANKTSDTTLKIEDVTKMLIDSDELNQKTISEWKNLVIVDRDSLNLKQIEQFHSMAMEKFDGKIDNILIDYGGLITGTDNYEGVSQVARGIKALAKRLHTRVMIVVQLSRAAKDGTIPVTIDMLRDTGAWEEAADYILGAWMSRSSINRIHMSIIKNRFGERNQRFDVINKGLHYTTESFVEDEF